MDEIQGLNNTLEEKLLYEVVKRSPGASMAFLVIALMHLRVEWSENFHSFLGLSCIGIVILISVIRFFVARRILQTPASIQVQFPFLAVLIMGGGLFWGLLVAVNLYDKSFIGAGVMGSIVTLAGLVTTTSLSLASHKRVGVITQVCFVLPALLVSIYGLFIEGNLEAQWSIIFCLVLWGYSLMQLLQTNKNIIAIHQSQEILLNLNKELATSQKNLAEQTAQTIHASRLASLGEMSGGLAHEINTPLSVIMVNMHILQKLVVSTPEIPTTTGARFQRNMKLIDEAVQRISLIVKGLLKFARQDDEEKYENFDFARVVNETLQFSKEKLASHDIEMRINLQAETLIYCRSTEIFQVMISLLNNSIHAIQKLPERWIEISSTQEKQKLMIRFRDSGTGISAEHQLKLFQPFFTTKDIGSGTGLGLSISKGIVASLKGDIRYDASDSHTCFVIELPLATQSGNQKIAS